MQINDLVSIIGTSMAMDVLLEEVELKGLLSAVKCTQLLGTSACITVQESDAIAAALLYYKQPSLDMKRPVFVVYKDSPAVDAGGPSRQFFGDVLTQLRTSYGLFEGQDNRVLPCYTPSVIASGLLCILGRAIVHSILHGGPGFPFLAPCVYRYLCTGSADDAVQYMETSIL